MSVLDREHRSLSQSGVTVNDIIANKSTIYQTIDNVDTGQDENETLRVSLTEQEQIIGGGGGVTKIATSQTQNLASAGQSFTIDLSTLTPPVSARNCAVWISEKGTAGGEQFAQELQFNQAYTGVVRDYATAVYAPDLGFVYAPPYDRQRFLKIDPVTKNSIEIGGSFGASVTKFLRTAYDPTTKKILATNNQTGIDAILFDTNDETSVNLGVIGTRHGGCCRASDGNFYMLTFGTGTSSMLKKVDPVSGVVTNVAAITGSGSAIDFLDITPIGDFIYTTSYQDTTRIISRIDITAVNPTWTTMQTSINNGFWLNPAVFGNKIYYASVLNGTEILVYDYVNNTIAYIAGAGTGWEQSVLVEDKIYVLPDSQTGFLQIDPATNTLRVLGTVTQLRGGVVVDGSIYCPPFRNNRVIEFNVIPPFLSSPSNPEPYDTVVNLFDTSGSINRMASTEDYRLDFTEATGNLTQVEVTMLTEGAKDVTAIVLSGGF